MMDIYDKVRSVPQNAQTPISGGRLKGMTDIKPQWRIQTLTEQFGPCGFGWYYEVKNRWTEAAGTEVCAFVDIDLYICYNGEWSKPISGTGGAKLLSNEKNGLYLSDECYKMATTDAISVACKQLGVGADVYWQSGQSKYSQNDDIQTQTDEPASEAPASEAQKKAIFAICKKRDINIVKLYEQYHTSEAECSKAIATDIITRLNK